MAFWGVEVKPGRPMTHKFDQERGRLHISQATLGLGLASNKSVVQCKIGNKTPVILCVLLPDKAESSHLDLEFEEADDVVFSVIGARSVFLIGYYSSRRHVNHNDSSESYGVDIANSDSEHSSHGSDEDSYEDSFINDDDPEYFSASPISSDIGEDEISAKKKPGKRKVSRKRLTKRYKSVVSEDENNSQMPNYNGILLPKSDDEDCVLLSTLVKSKTTKAEETLEKEMSKTGENNIENGGPHLLNRDNRIHDMKKENIDNQLETPEGVLVLENNYEDCAPISALLESKKLQTEGKLEKEISKNGDSEMENGGSHLPTQDICISDEQTDIEIQSIVMKNEKTLHLEEKTVENGQATDSKEDQTCGDLLLMESKTIVEEKLETEISNIGDDEIENGGSHLNNRDNSKHDYKTDDIDNQGVLASKSKKERKERTQEMQEAYGKSLHLEEKTLEKRQATDSKEDQTCGDLLLMESKMTLVEEKVEKETSNIADDEIENGGSHLETQENSIHANKTDDINNLAVNASKSEKKRKKRTEETPEAYGEIQKSVMKDEQSLQLEEKMEEEALVTDREKDQTCVKSDKENDVRSKKRRKKSEIENTMENKSQKLPHHMNIDLAPDRAVDDDLLKDKKGKKKKKNKTQGKASDKKIGGSNDDNIESKLSMVRTLSNGLIIEDIDMGKPDGRVATSGKKIKVNYVGKLRDGGQIIDSNNGKSPLKFRLGDGGMTDGWNIGLEGMRVGGKRRLSIPPTNGAGSRGGAGEKVPPNAWLVYEFELVKVR